MAEHVKELLSAYIDDEVSDDERDQIRTHLVSCEECRETLYELQLLKENVFHTYENITAQENLESMIMARIRGLEPNENALSPLLGWMTGLVAFLALVGMVLLAVPFVHIIAKLVSVFATITMKILHTIPIVVSAVPYLNIVLFGASFILIGFSVWFLYRLLFTGSYDRRELL